MPEIKINNRLIGEDHPPIVIAEMGINHEGSLDLAIAMADSAIEAGAEIIKHQTHIVEDEMSDEAKSVIPGNADVSIYEIMDRCALDEQEELKLMKHIQSKKCIFISTPFSRAAADRLKRFNVPAYKIGSGECNNYPLLNHIASFGKPVILSTGMNDIEGIRKSVKILNSHKVNYAILHTTNLYPTPDHLVRLGAISELFREFPDTVIGLSDHTLTNHSSFGAIALGASIIERHYTDTKKRIGPDIICSMDEKDCKELIIGSEIIFKQRGGQKVPVDEEKDTANFAFASVVSIKKIRKGEKFSEENLWVKRPGTGEIMAEDLPKLYGKVAMNDIENDEFIKIKDYKHD